jgi:hypothetical protein
MSSLLPCTFVPWLQPLLLMEVWLMPVVSRITIRIDGKALVLIINTYYAASPIPLIIGSRNEYH